MKKQGLCLGFLDAQKKSLQKTDTSEFSLMENIINVTGLQ